MNQTQTESTVEPAKSMNRYEVCNVLSGHSFGVYEAETAAEAIDLVCRDAGYRDLAHAIAAVGDVNGLAATEVDE